MPRLDAIRMRARRLPKDCGPFGNKDKKEVSHIAQEELFGQEEMKAEPVAEAASTGSHAASSASSVNVKEEMVTEEAVPANTPTKSEFEAAGAKRTRRKQLPAS